MSSELDTALIRAGLRMPLEAELQAAWTEVDGQKMTIRYLHAACDLKTTYGDRQKARADRLRGAAGKLIQCWDADSASCPLEPEIEALRALLEAGE
jgi:hypothetical protein